MNNFNQALTELNNAIKALNIANQQLVSAINNLKQLNKPKLKIVSN